MSFSNRTRGQTGQLASLDIRDGALSADDEECASRSAQIAEKHEHLIEFVTVTYGSTESGDEFGTTREHERGI